MKLDLDFSNINVLIVGDVMIDRYMYGDIYRQSPEAPDIPVLENIKIENRLGGAANVGLNIKALGATPYLCGIVGKDENNPIFMSELKSKGLSNELIIVDDSRKTTVKTRVISDNKHIVRVDIEDTFEIAERLEKEIWSRIVSFLKEKKVDILIFQDYNKGMLSKGLIAKLLDIAKEYGIKTAVDPKNKNFFEYKNVDIFKPNRREVEDQLGMIENVSISELSVLSNKIRIISKAKIIIITLSENGIFYDDQGNVGILPIVEREIVDVSGAGDSVLSILCLSYIRGYDIKDMIMLCNQVGSIVCAQPGVESIDLILLKSQVRQLM